MSYVARPCLQSLHSALFALGSLLLGFARLVLYQMLASFRLLLRLVTYIIISLFLLIVVVVLAQVIIILIIIIVEVASVQIVIGELLKGKSLTSEPVDGTGDKLLLDILTELVVKLEALLDVGLGILIVVVAGSLGRGEEVEERLCGDCLLHDTGLLSVWIDC